MALSTRPRPQHRTRIRSRWSHRRVPCRDRSRKTAKMRRPTIIQGATHPFLAHKCRCRGAPSFFNSKSWPLSESVSEFPLGWTWRPGSDAFQNIYICMTSAVTQQPNMSLCMSRALAYERTNTTDSEEASIPHCDVEGPSA